MQEKSKVISYSLFGFGKVKAENCFEFNSYLRGLMINIRLARLIYPDWMVVLHIDQDSFLGFQSFFEQLPIKIIVCEDAPLTKAMLWRMKPCFEGYEAVICRDLDSPITFREAQAVQHWLGLQKCAHAITDSISHNLPMLGGMVGFKPHDFIRTCDFENWNQMIECAPLDWSIKGSDQDFLNAYIYRIYSKPQSDSIVQHYVKGMPNTYLSAYFNYIPDIDLPNVPREYAESNNVCGHIGAAGWYETSLFHFLRKYWNHFDDLLAIERAFQNIFYWCNE